MKTLLVTCWGSTEIICAQKNLLYLLFRDGHVMSETKDESLCVTLT